MDTAPDRDRSVISSGVALTRLEFNARELAVALEGTAQSPSLSAAL